MIFLRNYSIIKLRIEKVVLADSVARSGKLGRVIFCLSGRLTKQKIEYKVIPTRGAFHG